MTHPNISATPVTFSVIKYGSPVLFYHTVCTERGLVEREIIDLGISDTKGRALGHRVVICREVHAYGTEAACSLIEVGKADTLIGESFTVTASTLRDGHTFGASQGQKRLKTLAEAQALRDAIFAKARKTVTKRSGANA